MLETSYKKITKAQSIDTGMSFTLLFLLFGNLFFDISTLNIIAIFTLIITMSVPTLFKPTAVIWFGLSNILGYIVSKIILGVVFYGFITPYSRLVFLFIEDPMRRNHFKKTKGSLFLSRNITYSKKDLEFAY